MRAMFDRIAGVYDLMNSVMTAGLHHRWRQRAADLAELSARRPRARRRHRHRRPGDRAGPRASAPGGEVVGSDFSEGMLDRARAQGAASCAGSGPTRWRCPYPDDGFDAATVGFGARNFADLDRGLRRDGPRRAAGRQGRRARDHDAAASRRCRRSSRCGSTASCRCWGSLRRRLHLPAELGEALPGPRGARRARWRARA